ncbi:MAG: hypothetical protein U5R48_10130 [Gammaproteobacteria bacterium]|nr:hypothetical protein [Gammaproteobacteria bacterium]
MKPASGHADEADGVGLDFGTSNSLAAIHSDRTRMVPLETGGPVMPTATLLDREFHALTGQAAIDRYIEDNRDGRSSWSRR